MAFEEGLEAYCGQVNKGLVERLQRRGVNALGLSGLDGRLWEGPRKDAIRIIDERGKQRVLRVPAVGHQRQPQLTPQGKLGPEGCFLCLTFAAHSNICDC